jgi:hypothetical protein
MPLPLKKRTGTYFALLLRGGFLAVTILVVPVAGAVAQLPPRLPAPPTPNFNPSTPYVVPQAPPVPVSPATPGTLPGSRPSDVNVSGPYSIMAPEPRVGKPVGHRHAAHHHSAVKHHGGQPRR